MDNIYSSIKDKFIKDKLSVYLKEKRVARAINIIILLVYLFICIFISYIY
jgi:hypothetical protein